MTQAWLTVGFVDAGGGVVAGVDEPVGDGVAVDAAERGDEVFGGAGSAAVIAADDGSLSDLLCELLDLQWRGFVETPVSPLLADSAPVGVVDAASSRNYAVGDLRGM